VAVRRAVGAAAAAGGGAACGAGNGFCFLQPENATKPTSKKAGTKIRFRIFNVVLPSRKFRLSSRRFGVLYPAKCLVQSRRSFGNLNPTKPASKSYVRDHRGNAAKLLLQ
jgi:hypothetical protein